MKQKEYLTKLYADGSDAEIIGFEYDDETEDVTDVIEDLRDNFSVDAVQTKKGLIALRNKINEVLEENILFSLIGHYGDGSMAEIIFENEDYEVTKMIKEMIETENLEDKDLTFLENNGVAIEFIDKLHLIGIYELKFVGDKK